MTQSFEKINDQNSLKIQFFYKNIVRLSVLFIHLFRSSNEYERIRSRIERDSAPICGYIIRNSRWISGVKRGGSIDDRSRNNLRQTVQS